MTTKKKKVGTLGSAFLGILGQLGPRFLPFADVATKEVPMGRLLRLSLFQVSVGMALVLLTGTLNRVMIVEMGVPSWLVALMVSLPLVFAPFRALIGFKSDNRRSALGWRRVPYIWGGTMLQFGGFSIMPFSLLILTGDAHGPIWIGHVGAALAFLLVGAGLHTTQTAGLALATDIVPEEKRPRVVAFLYVMLLVGMVGASLIYGRWLTDFSPLRLIQMIQGAALVTMILNSVALWKQEPRDPSRTNREGPRPSFRESWRAFTASGHSTRVLVVVGCGTAGFSMQDILLEPYGGQVLHLSVGATTLLTALMSAGSLVGFWLAARQLGRGVDPYRLARWGVVAGVLAFVAVIISAPIDSPLLFRIGTALIGFGSGLFAVGTLTAAMSLGREGESGLALGAWGAVQATASGVAIATGGAIRDVVADLVTGGAFGSIFSSVASAYGFVYVIEVVLLFITLIAIGPLVRFASAKGQSSLKFGLAEFPG
ncbi:MFS transporter [Rhodoplanes elegans]|uniref:MFS transporter n=1 Tax=Rhodoplanes elegans TaxID=29408 RepID=A0A327KLI7_9BRAD|nr:BCD family MFS transporter [Rhodoplanes elegans]MBK5958522.1 MFS transporter [Rhodoplanes elegans]RAI39639.1 MFS transporter [Rhodoplanes elegans]